MSERYTQIQEAPTANVSMRVLSYLSLDIFVKILIGAMLCFKGEVYAKSLAWYYMGDGSQADYYIGNGAELQIACRQHPVLEVSELLKFQPYYLTEFYYEISSLAFIF
ncbi:hypothetical protein O6P43_025130 [Quillaja saponaria]|uniref:Uncharacterized protein n=1 Tax=Quillaja saponaria TaxID=32244 RepID=A0AAD7L8N2_QUISA|nr:hypothetical protein O6P43_025130 [Quillaja saponaria]